MTIDDVTDELYGLAPGDFVRRRTELAREARAAGDRELARQITALRRPTQVAWAINQWVRTDPDGVAALLDLAAELLAAQRRSSADRLRALAHRRQDLIAECVGAIRRGALQQQVTLSDNAIREVGQSLRAAVADDEVAETLRRGQLVTATEYSGFGPAGVFVVPDTVEEPDVEEPVVDDPGGDPPSPSAADTGRRLHRARRAVVEAEDAERLAASALAERDDEVARARAHADELSENLDRLRAELERRHAELRFAVRQVDTAEEQRRMASHVLDDAREHLTEARDELARTEGDR